MIANVVTINGESKLIFHHHKSLDESLDYLNLAQKKTKQTKTTMWQILATVNKCYGIIATCQRFTIHKTECCENVC